MAANSRPTLDGTDSSTLLDDVEAVAAGCGRDVNGQIEAGRDLHQSQLARSRGRCLYPIGGTGGGAHGDADNSHKQL